MCARNSAASTVNNGLAAQRPWCSESGCEGGKQERQFYATQSRETGGHLGAGQSVSCGLNSADNESRKGLVETLRLSEASIRRLGLEERCQLARSRALVISDRGKEPVAVQERQ